MNLNDFGLSQYQNKIEKLTNLNNVARVLAEHKTYWSIITPEKETKGIILEGQKRKMNTDQLPKVGDFVEFETIPGERKVKISKVLPRFSVFAREKSSGKQVLATNIDLLCVVVGLDQNLNLSQLQRYVAMGLDQNIKVIIVLNKADKVKQAGPIQTRIQKSLKNISIITSSAKVGTGLDQLTKAIKPGHTAIFLGASGAGKSSILNALLKQEQQSVGQTRSDGKGRHTTTHREMFLLPSGGIVIDTPGIRTLEQDSDIDAGKILFEDLDNLSKQCKFRNCDHIKSKGCAILEALEANEIQPDTYKQYLKLTQADQYEQSKQDIQIQMERRAVLIQRKKDYRKRLNKK